MAHGHIGHKHVLILSSSEWPYTSEEPFHNKQQQSNGWILQKSYWTNSWVDIYVFMRPPIFYPWMRRPGTQHYLRRLVDHLYGQAGCSHCWTLCVRGSSNRPMLHFPPKQRKFYFSAGPLRAQNILRAPGGHTVFSRLQSKGVNSLCSSMQSLD